ILWKTLSLADAREQGATMLFGEKYPDPVRMVSMGDFSKELCGGTHLDNTEHIEHFEILSEEGVSAGTRRIVAVTGRKAREYAQQIAAAFSQTAKVLEALPHHLPIAISALLQRQRDLKKQLSGGGVAKEIPSPTGAPPTNSSPTPLEAKQLLVEAARLLSVSPLAVPDRVAALKREVDTMAKQLADRDAAGPLSAETILESSEQIGDVTLVITEVHGVQPNLMRQLVDQVRQKVTPSAILLASKLGDDKVSLIAGISQDLEARGASAGDWIRPVAQAVGGGGGGRTSMAQAGGKHPAQIPEALQVARQQAQEIFGS
ncbi:MAG: DHHA1 domain-containing protein, partial [Pirellulales bacterium]|nr:DHHA1 domain-containing protein [Pirellulales bacterium]